MSKLKRKLKQQKKKHEISLEDKYALLVKIASIMEFSVISGRSDEIVLDEKIIRINQKQNILNKIIGLAHELGHAFTLPACIEKFGYRVLSGPPKHWPSLEAELLAWSAADVIMDILGLYNKDYVKLKHTFLRRYYRITKNKS